MATYLLSRVVVDVVVLGILFFTCNAAIEAGRRSKLPHQQDLEDQNQLKLLNRPPVKSIKSQDGDIIDCILIANQPAFDHPSLKNHTIEMRPSYIPEGVFIANKVSSKRSKPIFQSWQLKGRCPKDTVPIRRTKEEDILRASSITTFGRKKQKTIPQQLSSLKSHNQIDYNRHQYSTASVQGDKLYGTKANINVWNPKVQSPSDFSLSQIWIVAGPWDTLNTIEAGWQVYPALYGDNRTRLFIYWTSDYYKNTGCYNLLCSGFIQLHRKVAVGVPIEPVSRYGGQQYEISIFIYQDPVEKHWWLICNGEPLGFWPVYIFSHLNNGAQSIEFGGEIYENSRENNQHTTTQMGSGHFAEERFGKASYFANIKIIDDSNLLETPQHIKFEADTPGCYSIKDGRLANGNKYFFYGGPGRNPNCP